jgi:hypothetical protein
MAQISKNKALDIMDNLLEDLATTIFGQDYITSAIIKNVRNVRVAIIRMFGSNSSQFQEVEIFATAILHPTSSSRGRSESAAQLIGLLRSIENEIKTFWEDEGSILEDENLKLVKETKEISKSRKSSKDKVFIIHGHDEGTKEKVARFLEGIDLKPIILHEKPENLNYRARQNVILELGFFMGKLGRKRVCALLGKDVEIPSDYSGVLYISLEEETWKFKLAKELKNVGFKIDMNMVL